MPFWVVGVVITLSMMFFLSNYVNAIVWQVRAQNAADSAASTSLAITANLWNEETTLLYTAALDENRIRYLNQALLNTINGVGCTSQANCASNYTALRAELAAAVSGYDSTVQLLRQGNNFTEAGQQADQSKAQSLIGNNCSNATDYTCAFAFTNDASNQTNGNSKHSITDPSEEEYVACKTLPYFGSALLNLGSAGSYKVIARGAAAILPANSESFDPGTQINPATGAAYQPVEHWASAEHSAANDTDFSGLTAQVNWYAAGTIRPFGGTGGTLSSSQYSCK